METRTFVMKGKWRSHADINKLKIVLNWFITAEDKIWRIDNSDKVYYPLLIPSGVNGYQWLLNTFQRYILKLL